MIIAVKWNENWVKDISIIWLFSAYVMTYVAKNCFVVPPGRDIYNQFFNDFYNKNALLYSEFVYP